MELNELLSIRPGLTAIIGSGGKTTAMYTLAGELTRRGRVICCTTTHILPPQRLPVLAAPTAQTLAEALERSRCLCVGTPSEGGKLSAPALPMAELTALADYVLVEADGSRGLPIKAHLPHEPVIPSEADQTVLVVGASGFGRPVSQAVHRPERFCRLTGLAPGDAVTPEAAARVIAAEGLAHRVLVNQVEDREADRLARCLAGELTCPAYAGAMQRRIWYCLS